MKLATSSGDFSHYYSDVSDKIKAYAGTNFKYLNFEQARTAEYLYAPEKTVTTLLNPSPELKRKAVEFLYETGKYVLEAYGIFEE